MADTQIITQLECKICHYRWYPRTPELPKVCPNCKHRDWDKEVKDVKRRGRPKRRLASIDTPNFRQAVSKFLGGSK